MPERDIMCGRGWLVMACRREPLVQAIGLLMPGIRLPFGQPGGITVLGSTAWISDWPAGRPPPRTTRGDGLGFVGQQQF